MDFYTAKEALISSDKQNHLKLMFLLTLMWYAV